MKKLFGTDGIRGVANLEITPELSLYVGKYASHVLGSKIDDDKESPLLIIGKDTRLSGNMIESAITSGALSVGANVISLGVVPTPAIPHLIKYYGADAGIMISASHNPANFNGIKLFDRCGLKLKDEVEAKIEALIHEKTDLIREKSHSKMGRVLVDSASYKVYEDGIKSYFDFDLSGMKIGLDCANGSNYKIGPEVIKEFGAEIYTIGTDPDGLNINDGCGSTSLDKLRGLVLEESLDIGLAFDGDADRLLAIDEKGDLIDGDRIMLALAKRMKEKGELKSNVVVATVMSNMGLYEALKDCGIRVEKTKVGDRYVLENMLKNDYSIGGEQSGHIIIKDFNNTGDGLYTALKLLEVLVYDVEKASEITDSMKSYPQVLKNVTVPNDIKYSVAEIDEVKKAIDDVESNLKDRGRVLLRASGTEPLVRVMLEGEDLAEINQYCDDLVDLIGNVSENM